MSKSVHGSRLLLRIYFTKFDTVKRKKPDIIITLVIN